MQVSFGMVCMLGLIIRTHAQPGLQAKLFAQVINNTCRSRLEQGNEYPITVYKLIVLTTFSNDDDIIHKSNVEID